MAHLASLPMTISRVSTLTCLALLLACLAGSPLPAHGPSAVAIEPTKRATTAVAHRVVWALASGEGSAVWSATPAGAAKVRLYAVDRGDIWNLAISRDGHHVAFPTFAHGRGRLLVTRTTGGPVVNLLANHRPFKGIGPIGWSPNGKKLVFTGFIDAPSTGNFYPSYLWTIHRDGTHLQRRALLNSGDDNGNLFGELGWTRAGIIYSNGDIRVLSGGRSARLLGRGSELYFSGNGRWIVFRRIPRDATAPQGIFRAHTDGTGLERLMDFPETPVGWLFGWAPNYDGSKLVGTRDSEHSGGTQTITFLPHEPHSPAVLPFAGQATTVDWN